MIEHKTVSLADQVFEQLETDILCGKYKRGEILTETKLSNEMSVSRTPIREALRRLAQEHLIEESSKGSIVLGITQKDLDDIYTVRKRIECIAAAEAARCSNEKGLNELKEAVEFQEFYLKKRDSDHIRLMDNKFHETLYRMSGSLVFYDVLVPLHKKAQKYRQVSVSSKSRATASVAEHRAIYNAIADKDEVLAFELMNRHIENAYLHIVGKD